MTFLTIDENKCKQDGICAAECPRQIITQEDEASFPQVAEADEAYCMACGHCVAVCPHGALSVTGVDIEDCPEIKKNLILSWIRPSSSSAPGDPSGCSRTRPWTGKPWKS